jgi:hypothetical protein
MNLLFSTRTSGEDRAHISFMNAGRPCASVSRKRDRKRGSAWLLALFAAISVALAAIGM